MSLFERSEYLRRIAAIRARMAKRSIDSLVITSPENLNYVTGYAGWSFYVPQAAILGADADPIIVVRHQDVPCADLTVFMSSDSIIGFPESYIGDKDKHPMSYIADVMRDRRLAGNRIAVEKSGHFFSVKSHETLRRGLPNSEFVDAEHIVEWVRVVKSPPEVRLMRQAGLLAEKAMSTAIEHIQPGVRECDVAAKIYAAQISGTDEFGGGVSGSVHMPSGERVRAPHLKWTDEKYHLDQGVHVELAGCRHQYHCALSRSVYLGRPPRELMDLESVVRDGMAAALDTARAGVLARDVHAKWKQTIEPRGYKKDSRIGYSIGLGFMPTWLERTVSLQQDDDTVLLENMTFHMICGMWDRSDKNSLLMSETFRVSDRGVEMFTTLPRQLFSK